MLPINKSRFYCSGAYEILLFWCLWYNILDFSNILSNKTDNSRRKVTLPFIQSAILSTCKYLNLLNMCNFDTHHHYYTYMTYIKQDGFTFCPWPFTASHFYHAVLSCFHILWRLFTHDCVMDQDQVSFLQCDALEHVAHNLEGRSLTKINLRMFCTISLLMALKASN